MRFATLLSLLSVLGGARVTGLDLASPGGRLVLSFQVKDWGGKKACPVYRLAFGGKPLLGEAALGLRLQGGASLEEGFRLLSVRRWAHDEVWTPAWGERSRIRNLYRALAVVLGRQGFPGPVLEIEFRCFDGAAAFRYKLLGKGRATILEERSRFRFFADHKAWVTGFAQGRYKAVPLSRIRREVERPLTLEIQGGPVVALAEAACVDYARMRIMASKEEPLTLVSRLSGEVTSSLPLVTPWRVIMVAPTPGRLLEGNDVILNLNAPCALKDTSWIRPGKVIREVTLTTKGGKACVDFCAARGLQFVEYDAGWYGPEGDPRADATTVTLDPRRSKGPLDLREVIRYARSKGIGVILYVNHLALERRLEAILPLYRKWGVAGVKYGFVRVGPQKWTSWLHRAVRRAAENRLMVDIHDEYRPTGYSRTYPNLMTQEGIRGDEARPTARDSLVTLFTRMLAGPADNTFCYYSERVGRDPTHACQLAKTVCLYSPWQFLFWYDRPRASPLRKGGAGNSRGVIGDEPELEFFEALPTTWDETRGLLGKIGKFAVIARRKGGEWFVGCVNAGKPRILHVDLGFLEKGRKYRAAIYDDDPAVKTRTHVRIRRIPVDSTMILRARLAPGGGRAIRIVPM